MTRTKLVLTALKGLLFYLGLVLLWGLLYYVFNAVKFSTSTCLEPNLWECIYFSCISFGTIGYGEIIPNHVSGQLLVFLQSISSIVFVGVYGGYITYLFLKRPNDIILTENIHLRPLAKDVLFSMRIGNKGEPLVDCKLEVCIMQIINDMKRIICKHEFLYPSLEYSWRPALTLNQSENVTFLNCFKTFYNSPENSLIRITMKGYDISSGEVIAIIKYFQFRDIKISGDYLPLYVWKGFERTKPVWANINKTESATKKGIDMVNLLLKQS